MPDARLPLTTSRLVLRDFVLDDWIFLHDYAQLPEMGEQRTAGEVRAHVERSMNEAGQSPRRGFRLAIQWRESGRLIGTSDLVIDEPRFGSAHIGYAVHPSYWREGIATEAAGELLRFGFEKLGLHRIEATCDPGNIASRRVIEKLGLTYEGQLRQNRTFRGAWRDSLMFSILEDEWRAR